MSELPPELFKRWVHSREEDTDEVRVYRPAGYRLPPARGRRGLELKEDGEFIEYGIAQTDKLEAKRGRWRAQGPDRAEVSLEDERVDPYTLEIVSLSEDRLEIRR